MSLDARAGRAKVSKGALVALEGARGNPNLATLLRLAHALERSVSSSTLVRLVHALERSVSSLLEDADEEPLEAGGGG